MRQYDLETQVWEETEPKPGNALSLLQSIYLDEQQPLSTRIRCAVEALPYELPKLSAVAHSQLDPNSFARALERAIARSGKGGEMAKVIEHQPQPE